VTPRRRRRGRRARPVDHPEPPREPREAPRKAELRRRAEFEARQARIKRARSVIGLLGFVPLGLSLLASAGVEALRIIPGEVYLGVWAAVFGTFIGLTVRMWRERRAFRRATAAT